LKVQWTQTLPARHRQIEDLTSSQLSARERQGQVDAKGASSVEWAADQAIERRFRQPRSSALRK
jgi:hypothetical protein